MYKIFIQKKQWLLIGIFFLAVLMIFTRLDYADSLTDGSHYSTRAVGYLDFLASKDQSSYIEWFKVIPWWSNLSFHDAPPLVFIIQHIFFKILGESIFTMRLPFALCGIGSLILVFFIIKRLYDENIAILSVFLLSISTFFTWSSRISYIEGMEVFFILLALYFFIKSIDYLQFFPWFGFLLGITLITKYTSFFILPFFFNALFLYRRKYFFEKKLWIGMYLAFAVFSPVLFYNIMLFRTRGHLDAQFSKIFPSMFEASHRDWPLLFGKGPSDFHFFQNVTDFFSNLSQGFSLPFYIFLVVSLVYIVFFSYKHRKEPAKFFLFLIISCIVPTLIFISPELRYLPLLTPFLAMAGAVFISDLLRITSKKHIRTARILIFFLSGIFIFEIFYNINTNVIYHPADEKSLLYSEIAEEKLGFNQLEEYLKKIWKNDAIYYDKIKSVGDRNELIFKYDNVRNGNIYLFDIDINWFGRIWYFHRNFNYHNVPIISAVEVANNLGAEKNLFFELEKIGVKNVYYIKGLHDGVYTPGYKDNKEVRDYSYFLERKFIEYNNSEKSGDMTIIYNVKNVPSFVVYRLELNK